MATATLEILIPETGLTDVLATVWTEAGTLYADDVAVTESGDEGRYTLGITAAVGVYKIRIVADGELIGWVWAKVTSASAGSYPTTDTRADLDASGISSTGGGGTSLVVPLRAVGESRTISSGMQLFVGELLATSLNVLDARGTPVDCTGMVADLLVDVDGTIVEFADITPTGSPPHKYGFTATDDLTGTVGQWPFALRRSSNEAVLAVGTITIENAVERA
jgi:hypothetical protein